MGVVRAIGEVGLAGQGGAVIEVVGTPALTGADEAVGVKRGARVADIDLISGAVRGVPPRLAGIDERALAVVGGDVAVLNRAARLEVSRGVVLSGRQRCVVVGDVYN